MAVTIHQRTINLDGGAILLGGLLLLIFIFFNKKRNSQIMRISLVR